MRVIVQIEQGRGRKIKRLIEDPLTGSEILRGLRMVKRKEVSKDTDICLIEKER